MTSKKRALRNIVEKRIREAFKGVKLGEGISLHQAVIVDNYGRDGNDVEVTDREWDRRGRTGVVNDWENIDWSQEPDDEDFAIAHLDDEGFRYYIPALMLLVIDDYDSGSMRVIGTLGGLYPRKTGHFAKYWDSRVAFYSIFSDEQKAAIALFVKSLPELVDLDADDLKIVERALRNYWHRFVSQVIE